jgi:electron transfer flavoprotein alpha subunit
LGAADAGTAEVAGSYGADVVYMITDTQLADYRLSAYADALHHVVEVAEATIVLTSATSNGRDLAAAVACDLDAGLAPDAVDLRIEDGRLVAVRPVYSNNILADVHFNSPVQVASVRPRSFPMPERTGQQAPIQGLDFALVADRIPEQVEASTVAAGDRVSLNDARIVVSGGRGVADDPDKGFALVAELAEALGGAVGASRAAVDAGFIPYEHQVGQTGKTVKPDLYIAAGISGAIQHLAGMGGSKIIVAINKDRNAPIFKRAHYGLVGDLYELLPALTAEAKVRLG